MAVGATPLWTVEQFRKLPQDAGAVYHELRHGKLVSVTRPKLKHSLIQRRLRRLLEDFSHHLSYVDTEVAFRPKPEFELWVADVAYLSPGRFARTDPEDNIQGAPDLVIEVLSPSNTADEMNDRERICLENGTIEFWVVDPKRQEVKVSTPNGQITTWGTGQLIPMPLFDNVTLEVDAIFQ